MDVLGGDAVVKYRIGGDDGFFGSGSDAKRVELVGLVLDPVLQTVLQEELEEHAVELHSYAWHFSLSLSLSSLFLSLQIGGFAETGKLRNGWWDFLGVSVNSWRIKDKD